MTKYPTIAVARGPIGFPLYLPYSLSSIGKRLISNYTAS